MKFATKAIHVGQGADPATGATIVPVYQTSTFTQDAVGVTKGYDYSRAGNPTRTALEDCLASLENAQHGLAYASGCAATAAICHLMKAGDHMVVSSEVYGGTYRLFKMVMEDLGLNFTFVNPTGPDAFVNAMTPKTKLVWLESPTNPLLTVIDIESIAKAAKEKGCLTIVDNTFASPYFQQPLALGADIVLHSTTKYIGGHSDVIGGCVMTNNNDVYEKLKFIQKAVGAVPGPMDCYLTLRGLKTLAIRMEQHAKNAQAIAEHLSKHPKVSKVFYPGLASHPQHALAKKQMSGFSGMMSFEIKGDVAQTKKVMESFKLFSLAESLGGVESLLCYPALMTHAAIPASERDKIGISDGLIRLSVGIEDVDDLIKDVDQALATI
ncbi:MAG: cystathionine gamma-synthase [Deltaproteobacteria bacterium CG11_big_fil_rev_8_21_14_0_20_47_16]|nr:MAG: cystathionine gamma-synthase [Deltaproteobacteria bacterium CG11_big_fil_rev_8_21_14_0_20_47_16]